MGLKLLLGENFSQTHSSPVLVTQSFVNKMSWKDPIGQKIKTDQPLRFRKTQGYVTITGVVSDFRPTNLMEDDKPIVLTNTSSIGTNLFLLKVNSSNLASTLAAIEDAWQDVAPECLFRFTFLDDQVALWYSDVTRWSRLIFYTALVTICIACLGIIGLLALALAARTKEIGIRKICGATMHSLFLLVTKRFAWLIGIAGIITAPLSWYTMQKWLQHFSLQINLNIFYFIAPVIIALGFVLLSVGFQAWKAAVANPVETLRYE
jgi:putative ABC transport system permease protein